MPSVRKGEIFLLPTIAVNGVNAPETYLPNFLVNNENEEDLCVPNTQQGEDLDTTSSPGESRVLNIDRKFFFKGHAMAANFAPFIYGGYATEIEMTALWDFYGGNDCLSGNCIAGETICAVAEEFRCVNIDDIDYLRLPLGYTLGRRMTPSPVNSQLGLYPSHYLVSSRFYTENEKLFAKSCWYQGNCEVDTAFQILNADQSIIKPGLFVIFSPTWLNPDPFDFRPYLLCVLLSKNPDKSEDMVIPYTVTIRRNWLGQFELFDQVYNTLFDLVYHLSKFSSSLPVKLNYEAFDENLVKPCRVPQPKNYSFQDNFQRIEPMFCEQWAAAHFVQVTSRLVQEERFEMVTRTIFDLNKWLHEKVAKCIGMIEESRKAIEVYIGRYKRPTVAKKDKKGENKKKKEEEQKTHATKNWEDLPKHVTRVHIENPFYLDLTEIEMRGKVLGSGAFGSVVTGQLQRSGSEPLPVAIKRIPMVASDKERRELVFNEIEILQTLAHPNLVLFHGFSIDEKSRTILLLFEIMETALDAYIEKKEGNLDLQENLMILVQICDGIDFLHTQQPSIVHGDLASRNVLLKTHPIFPQRKIAKVTDFGLSKCVRDETYATYDDPNKIPFKWLPPEVLAQRELTPKTDVWSFAMVCHEMYLIGEPYGILPPGKVYHFLRDGYRFEKQRNMPNYLYELTLECWRRQPIDRPTILYVRQQLNSFIVNDEL